MRAILRFILMVGVAACIAAQAQQGVPVRVAVYADAGSPRTPRDMQRVLGHDSNFIVRNLTAEDIQSGGLKAFQVLVQGGGDSRVQSRELKEKGRDAIREFVRSGGGYVGICGGAHFAVPGDGLKLGILNARVVDNEHWARGHGDVILDFTPAGQKELSEASAKTKVMYHQGPLLQPGDRTDLPAYTTLATYATEVAKNGAPHGVMQGTTAIASAPYGKGRVFVFSPHPEQTEGQEALVRQAIFWAAGRSATGISNGSRGGPMSENPDMGHPGSSGDVLHVSENPTHAAAEGMAPSMSEDPGHPAQVVSTVPVDAGCCGPITPKGALLMQYLDSLNVDHLWAQHTHVDWQTGVPTPSHGHHEPKTHCSAFAAAAAMRLNIYMLRPPDHKQHELSTAQLHYFGSSEGRKDGWTQVQSSQQAQSLANQGEFVALVTAGHIAIVRPKVKSMKALEEDGPETTQAGGHNFSDGTAKYSFVFHPGAWPNRVKMFAHTIDFGAQRQAPKPHDASEDDEDGQR